MIEVRVEREIQPAPIKSVTITLDERTARAFHALAGMGTIHFSNHAEQRAIDSGFRNVGDMVAAVQSPDDVWTIIGRALGRS